jgi:hypothetical protein
LTLTDIRLDQAAVVVDGDLRVEAGTITSQAMSAPAINGHRGRFLHEVSGTAVTAQVLVVSGALRATSEFTARNTASVPVEAVSIALDHPTAPRLKKSPPNDVLRRRDGGSPTEVQRPPGEESPGPRPEPMVPVPRRLALTHEYGGGADRLVLNHQRRYAQGVHVDGDLVVSGTIAQASSARLKRDVETLPSDEAARAIDALRPVKFSYRNTQADRRHAGFIAEEVAAVLPGADDDRVRPLDLIAMLTAVVQDQQRAIAGLTERVAALSREHVA